MDWRRNIEIPSSRHPDRISSSCASVAGSTTASPIARLK
jgi:hypothetical protein